MLMSFLFHLLSAWFAFLLPSYATFKALTHRPVSDPDLERLAKYWAVVGAFVAVEYTAEWLWSWFPFFWEIKTLFLLFLSLPQIQGSTFVYDTYFAPFLTRNEADLDAGIAAAQQNTLVFVQARVSGLWDIIWSIISKTPVAGQPPSGGQPGQPGQPQQGGTASGGLNFESAMGLWRTYAPAVTGYLSRGQQGAQARSSPAPRQPASSPYQASASTTSFQPNASSASLQPNAAQSADHVIPHTPIGTPGGSEPGRTTPSFPQPQIN